MFGSAKCVAKVVSVTSTESFLVYFVLFLLWVWLSVAVRVWNDLSFDEWVSVDDCTAALCLKLLLGINLVYFLLTVSLETIYLRIYWTNLHQIFLIGTCMGGHDQSDFFVIAQGTLLWWPIFGASRRKLAYPTFILCTGIPQRMGASLHCRWPLYV